MFYKLNALEISVASVAHHVHPYAHILQSESTGCMGMGVVDSGWHWNHSFQFSYPILSKVNASEKEMTYGCVLGQWKEEIQICRITSDFCFDTTLDDVIFMSRMD